MTFIQHLLSWIARAPVTVSAIEEKAGIPKTLLHRAIRHNEGVKTKGSKPLSESHHWQLAIECAKVGLEIQGWSFFYHPDSDSFLLLKLSDPEAGFDFIDSVDLVSISDLEEMRQFFE